MGQGYRLWFGSWLLLGLFTSIVVSANQGEKARFTEADIFVPPTTNADDAMTPAEAAEAWSVVSVNAEGKTTETVLKEDDVSTLLSGTSDETDQSLGEQTGGSDLEDKVIGIYKRKEIEDTSEYPYRTIGRIAVGCTGTLIGPRHVLTAGHCVYNTYSDSWHKKLTFTPGQSGDEKPYGDFEWEKIYITKGWAKKHNTNFDFALIVLKEPIGKKLGWMKLAFDKSLSDKKEVTVAGYPGDKPKGTQWTATCPIDKVKDEQVHYLCDTYGGNSGSSVWTYDKDKDLRAIFAIHTNGYPKYNRGTRMTAGVFHTMKQWRDSN